jgi:hypothetical protein
MKYFTNRILFFMGCVLVSCNPLSSKKKIANTDTIIVEKKDILGNIYETESYFNEKLDGPTKGYYSNGKIKYIRFYKNGGWTGELRTYTRDGKLATIKHSQKKTMFGKEVWQSKTEIVYWEEIPVNTEEFLHVSDSGYFRVKDFKYPKNNDVKPDNIFETKFFKDSSVFYIWKTGKKEWYKTIRRSD